MTRLFLRFYLGVIAILFVAWWTQAYVFRRGLPENNIRVIEEAVGGGAKLAREQIMAGGEAGYEETISRIRTQFDYPVVVVNRVERPMSPEINLRIDQGEAVLYYGRILVGLPDTDLLLELGPLPKFGSPTQADVTIGLGAVFLFTAFAIAILLRPVLSQLRGVERTALAISEGDLSARIDRGRFKRSLPLAEAFNSMADRLESLLRSQKEMLQAVSHELRTPLAKLRFATELIRTAEDGEQRESRIEAIDDATDQLDDLVGELLTYVRLDEQAESAKHETIDLGDLIDELIFVHAPLHDHIDFSTSVAAPSPKLVAHRPAISRAVGNLIGNACKHARSKITVSASRTDDQVRIIVDDDGAGIAVPDRERVFEPFTRLADAEGSGSGLGLALVRRIVRRSGGEVRVSESPQGGARFEIVLKTVEDPTD